MRIMPTPSTTMVAVALPAMLLGLAACGGSITPAQKAQQCSNLAVQLASQGLEGVPTEKQARDIGNRLDGLLNNLGDPTVHDAAVQLHATVHAIEAAAKKGDTARVTELTDQAREEVAKAAKACGLPESQFLG